MHPGLKTLLGAALVTPGLLIVVLGQRTSHGDELGRLGRLFRLGGNAASTAATAPESESSLPPPSVFPPPPSVNPSAPTVGPAPRLIPQPRVSRAITESDPIVTQFALIRTNDGSQFGTFLQVFADGTVLNSEGVHHVSPADLKPVMDALQMGELYRQKGHCGAPATDYVEQVHVVVYERSMGRLRAHAFSYSGNPQGCDHAVLHLHAALEGLQTKLSRPIPAGSPGPSTPASGLPASPPPGGGPNVIPLTPLN